MVSFKLVILPGRGREDISVPLGTTVAQFAADRSLSDREFIVNGETVPRARWSNVTLDHAVEVFATGSVKGNL